MLDQIWSNNRHLARIRQHTIEEEAANSPSNTSQQIRYAIEQFREGVTDYRDEAGSIRYQKMTMKDAEAFTKSKILMLAAICSRMHPESTYSHVHTGDQFHFAVHA